MFKNEVASENYPPSVCKHRRADRGSKLLRNGYTASLY